MPFDKFAEGATPQPGLFTVWRKQGQVYLELSPEQFDRPYLLVPILASGYAGGLFAGIDFDPILMQFHRNGPTVYTTEQNTHAKVRPGTPAAAAVDVSYPQSVINSDPETTVRKDNGDVVFPASVLLTDILDLTDIINGPPVLSFGPAARYHLDSRLSYFGPTKSFPKNVEIESDLTMSSFNAGLTDTVPDSRSLFLRVHYSIDELPNDGYKPRYADDRLGFFVTARRQYDDPETTTSFVRYIDRWNIQKRDPRARVSPAKNPIVYYISNDVPTRYRAPIKTALLTWNKAFAAIGISGAIVVRQQPSDPAWDPDDARYSVVRWVVSPSDAFAYGPAIANPLTGEIFRADVVIDGNLVRFGHNEEVDVVDPTRGMSAAQRNACSLADCDYGYGAYQQAGWAALALSMDGATASSGRPSEAFVKTFLTSIVLHESGHNLGLRHNFASSTIYAHANLHDAKFTAQHGLVGSVMDYTPVNLSPHGQPQGSYFQTVLGPWDYFNVKYGYERVPGNSPDAEKPALQALAAQTSQHDLVYGTDEDNEWFDGFASDPRVETFDLSSDPLAYAQDEFTIDRRLLATMPTRLPLRGHSYVDVRRGFIVTLANIFSASNLATHYIGGESFSRGHRGDPGNPVPFTPVPRDVERRAFALLEANVFGDDALRFSPDLLNRLGDTRFNHWESDPNAGLRIDFPVEEFVENNQIFLLRQMWQPTVLGRLDSLDARSHKPGETMSLADLYDWTDHAIWGDLGRGGVKTVPEVHRVLQQRYADLLAHIMLRPDPGTPLDAGALARHHLVWLQLQLDRAIARGGYDEATTANFEQVRAMTARALAATTVVPSP
jgi:uncharacterized protein DUF4953/uncharacterized protein DUF5117/uncharacterized protein DUF5118